jgi:mediator of RNA polymerase II transcription subunit 18
VIQMFQQEQVRRQLHTLHSSVLIIDIRVKVDPRTQQPIPAHADTLWEVEVKTASPIRNTQETPLSQSVDAVLEVQLLMKGLLDLRRQDL